MHNRRELQGRGLRRVSIYILTIVGLLGFGASTHAQATQTIDNGCMEEVAGFALNCTANDVQIAGVATDPATGEPMLEILDDGCAFPGDTVTFSATFEVVLTAQARHDIGIYFATDGDGSADGAITGECSISTIPFEPEPDYLDLDGFNDGGFCANDAGRSCENDRDCKPVGGVCVFEQDTCGDIDSGHNPLFPVITITTTCIDPDGNRTLNLPNCTSWRQPGANELCTGPLDAFPGAPSKCRCDLGFEVPIEVPPAELQVVKSANPSSLAEPGGDVTFDVSVTNLSSFASVTLTQLGDDEDNDGTDDTFYDPSVVCGATLLGPGESTLCQFTRTLTGNAGDLLTDVATVTGTDSEGNTVSGSDDATVTITDVPAVPLTVVKSVTSEASLPEPGGDFDFQVVVTNGSTVDTAMVTDLDDTFLADLQTNGSCVDQDGDTSVPWELSPGESMTCTFTVSHTGQPATFDNQVTVAATDDDGADVGAVSNVVTVEITDVPAVPLTVVKSVTSEASLPEPGGDFDFQVVVTNGSTVDTAMVTDLDDTFLADLQTNGSCVDQDGDISVPWELSPGESMTCTFTVSHTGQPATFDNQVTVAATDDDGADVGAVSNVVTVEITDVPAVPLTVVKAVTSAASLPEPGGDFEFQAVATNGSTIDTATVTDLDDTFLADLQNNGSCVDQDGDTSAPWELSPGESMTCTFTVSHIGDPDTFDDQVTVTATDDDGADVGAVSNVVTVEITDVPPAASLTKTATSAAVTYRVVVRNESTAESLTLDNLLDDRFQNVADPANPLLVSTTCSVPQSLQPAGQSGDSYTCSFVAIVDALDSPHTNTVTGSISDNDEPTTVTPSDSATVELK